jgi:anti-sigma factor RsiW
MNCRQAEGQLSIYQDRELAEDEQQALEEHLRGCKACRLELAKQGALDMLLKRCVEPRMPEDFDGAFWPTIEERLENDPGDPAFAGAGSGGGREYHFRSSPALQALRIPGAVAASPGTAALSVAAPAVAELEPTKPSYRWPVAFVFATLIVVAGGVYMMSAPAPQPSATLALNSTSAASDKVDVPKATAKPTVGMAANSDDTKKAGTGADVKDPFAKKGAENAKTGTGDKPTGETKTASPAVAAKRERKRSATKKASTAKSTKAAAPAAPAKKVATLAAPAKPAAKKKPESIDSLIDNALGGQAVAKPKAAKAPVASDAPKSLTMNQIRGGMRKIKPSVQACYDKYQVEGKATVKMTIAPNGTVSSAKIKGKFFGSDTGACVVRAAKKAKFPKFSGPPMAGISYPFMLQ